MRRFFAFAGVFVLAACSGGGGGSVPSPGNPAPAPTPGQAAKYEKPKFTIKIPKREKITKGRVPQFVSSATLSVKITLTADTAGITPSTIAGNPAIDNVSSGSCSSGCTIAGPPSPIGMDTYSVTTYDAASAGGNALDTNTTQITILQGVANSGTVTLQGIPAAIQFGGSASFTADTVSSQTIGGPTSGGITVKALDADNQTITGTYANPITVSDPDTNGDGTSIAATCPASVTADNPTQSATSAMLVSDSSTTTLCYEGIAENPVTLGASATGAAPGSLTVKPTLNAPAYVAGSGTPTTVVVGSSPPDVQLIATSGLGSTGSANFSEAGWTDAPYSQQLTAAAPLGSCTKGSSFASYATVATSSTSSATTFTVTAITSTPAASQCPLTIIDGLNANSTDGSATLATSYTSSSIGVNNKPHHN